MDIFTYNQIFTENAGICEICGKHQLELKHSLQVDCGTGEMRGLVCRHCYKILYHSDGDIAVLKNAIEYLMNYDFMECNDDDTK